MKEIKVKVLEDYQGHMNPDRKYHLVDIENDKRLVGNLKKEEIEQCVNNFHLTLVEWNGKEWILCKEKNLKI